MEIRRFSEAALSSGIFAIALWREKYLQKSLTILGKQFILQVITSGWNKEFYRILQRQQTIDIKGVQYEKDIKYIADINISLRMCDSKFR